MKKCTCLLLCVVILTTYSCKKNSESNQTNQQTNPEALPPNEVAILDSMPNANNLSVSNIILPNGLSMVDYLKQVDTSFLNKWILGIGSIDAYAPLGPQDARNLLICRISAAAWNLTDRSKHQISDEGVGKPSQNGLAYSWGSKDETIRQSPPGEGSLCTDQIYGLDCSGFIYKLFNNAGVSLLSGPANSQRDPTVLQTAIKSSIPSLAKVKVDNLGKLPTSKFESGDIIYWTNPSGIATHIGMVLKDVNSNLNVFQSNGSVGNSDNDCINNTSLKRGPRRLYLTDPYWFGKNKNYGITRINADISGQWNFTIKCNQPNATNLTTYNLDFPTNTSDTFEIDKSFVELANGYTDYENFVFSYDNTTNILSCVFHETNNNDPTFYRYDSFSQKLTRDSIGYFPATLGASQNAGCQVLVKLVAIN